MVMPSKYHGLEGKRFGRTTVVKRAQSTRRGFWYECLCDCGTIHVAYGSWLGKYVKSCGCLKKSKNHGYSQTGIYRTWSQMKTRCLCPTTPAYQKYGGRGIMICDRWLKFENFLADMGPRPAGTTLDRIDNNGNYEPGNCRWATKSQQQNNTRRNVYITMNGRTQTLKMWLRELGRDKDYQNISRRIRCGYDPMFSLHEPITDRQRDPVSGRYLPLTTYET